MRTNLLILEDRRSTDGFKLKRLESVKAIIGVTDYLFAELSSHMEREGRRKGIVISFFDSIQDSFSEIHKEMSEKDAELESKMLYLLKPSIQRELRRLERRKLSKADCIIVMLNRFYNSILAKDLVENYYKTLQKIIQKLYNNIRTKGKTDSMFNFSNLVQEVLFQGWIGKYKTESFIAFLEREVECRDRIKNWEKSF